MKRLRLVAVLIAGGMIASGCSREPAGLEIQQGTQVTVQKKDGGTVAGRLVDVQPQEVVLEAADGQRTRIPKSEIRAFSTVADAGTPAPPAPEAPAPPAAPQPDERGAQRGAAEGAPAETARAAEAAAGAAEGTARVAADAERAAADAPKLPEYRQVEIPAGTALPINLKTTVGSATSRVEDQVRGTLRRAITIDGVEAIPAGATVIGAVTAAERSGRVKGRARVAFRFTSLDLPGDAERIAIRTSTVAQQAEGTKKQDAAKIGGGAAAGALIGGIIGGGDGAAKGAAIGGGAGTGVVLSTRGREVTVPAGSNISVKLLEPVTVRVRVE